jgi:hypothetical protein
MCQINYLAVLEQESHNTIQRTVEPCSLKLSLPKRILRLVGKKTLSPKACQLIHKRDIGLTDSSR